MALSLDGSNFANANPSSSVVISLTTTAGSGVIVVSYIGNAAPASSNAVTASGLTFTQRGTTGNTGGDYLAEFTAPYTSNFSGNITVTASSSTYLTAVVFGIGGAATSSYFDTNGSLPLDALSSNADSTGAGPISTTASHTFIFCALLGPFAVSDTNFVQIQSGAASDYNSVGYYIASTAQTNLTCKYASGAEGVLIFMDAIVAFSPLPLRNINVSIRD